MLTSKHMESDLCLWQKVSHRQEIIPGSSKNNTYRMVNLYEAYIYRRIPLFTDSHILGTIFMQVCAKYRNLLCSFCWVFFHKISPTCLLQITIFFSWYNLKKPRRLFCNVTSFKQLTVTGSCRCFSTLTKQDLFTSCTQPGIIWLERLCLNLNFFITLADI